MKRLSFVLAVTLLYSFYISGQDIAIKYKGKSYAGAVYSYDKTSLAIADRKKIAVYTSGTDSKVFEVKGLNSFITEICYSLNDTDIITGGYGNKLYILDARFGEKAGEINLNDSFYRLFDGHVYGIDPVDLSTVAVIKGKNLYLVDLNERIIIWTKLFNKQLRALAVDVTNRMIYVGGGSKSVVRVSADNPEEVEEVWSTSDWVRSIDIHADKSMLAIGTYDGIVHLIDSEKKTEIKSFYEFKDWVSSVEFSGDGSYLAIAAKNGEAKVYSIEQQRYSLNLENPGRPLLSATFNLNGEELVTTGMRSKPRSYDITPLNISPVYNLKDESDNTAPQIYISNPPNIQNDRYRYSKDLIKIQGSVMDESGIRLVKVNGIKVPVKDNGNFVINLPLQMGDNYITIEALDINENTGLKKFVINRRDLDGNAYSAIEAKNYLFVVGIDDYQNWPKLYNAVRDANSVVEVLMGQYQFDFSDITILKNEQATRSNIYNGLRTLIEKVTPQDNLVIYYSGHGEFDELLNEGYWVPVEAEEGNNGDYLSNSDILKVISNINSQHTFMVVDACFSGSLFVETSRGYTENVERYRSRWGLASGRLETVSDGAYGENSPFATAFIDYLKSNDKKSFPVSELVQHVKVEVANQAQQTPHGNPLRGTGDEGGEFIFYKRE